MLPIKCLATGSDGNCYLVQVGTKYIILEAGIPIEKIIKNVNLNDVLFAYVSHEHNDHKQSMSKLKERGVKVLYGALLDKPFGPKQIEDITIWTVPIQHGDTTNSALIIQYLNDILFFGTDFSICRWNLKKFKFTQILVECNYIETNIQTTLSNPSDENYQRAVRQINTHMGLNGTIEFLKKQDLSQCKEIYLLHMSLTYGNGSIMGSLVYGMFQIPVKVCKTYGGFWEYGSE